MASSIYASRIVVSDVDRSIAFYTTVFGLTLTQRAKFLDPDIREAILVDGAGASFVVMAGESQPVHSGQPTHAALVVFTDDIDKTVASAKAAGGELVFEPISLGPASVTMVADPDGYLIEVASMSGDVDLSALEVPRDENGNVVEVQQAHPVAHIHDRVLK
ncbi:VOC family protein [Diaminobutyricibacter sp. McL0618]|uniref:VOC family protein n=1 Tax=Leifsonia sp. McL0618 TaxID=3415677 RepID=UPI003CEF14AA